MNTCNQAANTRAAHETREDDSTELEKGNGLRGRAWTTQGRVHASLRDLWQQWCSGCRTSRAVRVRWGGGANQRLPGEEGWGLPFWLLC